jgi:hypothetical protein
MKKALLFLFTFAVSQPISAQSFGLDWLFKPGVRASFLYIPKQSDKDSAHFGLSQVNLSFILPLGGKASLDLKALDLKARQTFLNIGTGIRLPQTNLSENQRRIYNFSLGITHLQVGLRNGIWLYTANAGMVQDAELLDKINLFGVVAFAKIRLRGLRKQDIYGFGVGYFNQSIIPFPILGLNRRLSKKWDFRLLLPVNLTLAYRASQKVGIDFSLNTNVFQTQVVPIENTTARWQYRQAQLDIVAHFKLGRQLRLSAETGLAVGRSLLIKQGAFKEALKFSPAPYFGVALRASLGKQLLGSDLFASEL